MNSLQMYGSLGYTDAYTYTAQDGFSVNADYEYNIAADNRAVFGVNSFII